MSRKSSLSTVQSKSGAVNCIIASRVSTQVQDERDTPQAQLARTRRYAEGEGYHVAGELREVITGASVAARSELRKIFKLAKDGQVQVLVYDKPDRLARGDAQTILGYEASQIGLRIEYATPGVDTSTPTGKMVRAVERIMSESERALFAERSVKGKRERMLRGEIVLPSRIPYGYKAVREFDAMGRKVSAQIVVDEEKIAVYHRARRLLVEERYSLNQILTVLNSEGIPAPLGGRWTRMSLRIILTNRIYAGEYRYGVRKRKTVDTKEGLRQIIISRSSDYVSVAVPAVITEAEYAEILTALEDNKRRFEHPRKYQYLLGGMIRCAKCGSMCSGCPVIDKSKVYLRYRCVKTRSDSKLCTAKDVPHYFADEVWDVVVQMLTEPESVASGQEETRRQVADSSAIEAEIRAQEKAISAAVAEMERVIRLQAKAGDISEQTAAAFTSAMLQIQQRIDASRAIMESIRKRGEEIKATQESAVEVTKLREEQAEKLRGDMSFEGKQQILRRIRLTCIWDSDKRVLTLSSLVGSAEIEME